MIEGLAYIRRIRSQAELDEVLQVAQLDKHDVLAPTHVVIKNGQIVGHFTINNVPMFVGHLSTTELGATDSFHLINTVESKVEDAGCGFVISPIGLDSPFHKYFPRMGYKKLANVDLFAKTF